MSAAEPGVGLTYLDLEGAIMDAEGAAAVLQVLENELTSSTTAGWKTLGLEPREGLCVTALPPIEQRALDHAISSLREAVAEVSRVFYAMPNKAGGR